VLAADAAETPADWSISSRTAGRMSLPAWSLLSNDEQ